LWCERQKESLRKKHSTNNREKDMNSVDAEVEEILKTDPLTWERTTSGFMTFLHGVSSMLNEALGAEYYAIVICNAPFERSTSVSICLFGGEYVRIAREEDVISSEENLMKIAEENYRNRIEKFLSPPRYNNKNMKYIVKNKLTDAICGEFETKGQAGKWVEVYTNEQNVGLSPDDPRYCSPFDFELIEQN